MWVVARERQKKVKCAARTGNVKNDADMGTMLWSALPWNSRHSNAQQLFAVLYTCCATGASGMKDWRLPAILSDASHLTENEL